MSSIQPVDLAILGGGCAGLSLAGALAERQVKRSVVVIESRQTYRDDRSWCFWAEDQHLLQDWVSFSWSAWSFGQAGQRVATRQQPGFRYRYVRSSDFYRNCLAAIHACPAIDLQLGQAVTALDAHAHGWQVTTDTTTYHAQQVLDTRPPAQTRIDQSTLLQCFLGVEIELEKPGEINTAQVELMTDMRLVDGEFCFTYILPYTQTRLLVEVTFFAGKRMDSALLQAELDQLLERRGWAQARIVRQEYGVLPMGLPREMSDSPNQPQPPQAGMRAGALRAASGYGFMRIQRWARQCAQQYCTNGSLLAQTGSNVLLNTMDQIFLNVIRKEPRLAPLLFDALLGQLAPARFIRFMEDRATLVDCWQVIACMPKIPFLNALLRR
jgi:lycopene beta-cyclase